ncbi:hypothetical protein, partial [Azospirillum griseum]
GRQSANSKKLPDRGTQRMLTEGPPSVGLISPTKTPSAPEPAPSAERRAALVEVVLANGRVLRVAEDIAPATLRRLVGALDSP